MEPQSIDVSYGEAPVWEITRPKIHPVRVLSAWLLTALALLVAASVVPGASIGNFRNALAAAAAIAVLNAVIPPVVAALRIPLMALLGFFVVLALDAALLLLADNITGGDLTIDSFWAAVGVALVAAAVGVVLNIVLGTNDDDTYTFRVIQRIARRANDRIETDRPGIVFLEIDGLALPVLQRAMRAGSAPTMSRWLMDGTHRLAEWETDLSSQTGASQAGILLGSNDDIPAFRWVEKETARLVVCSAPADCAEIERRHLCGRGLLADGGASRGNLLSGEADEVILTASRAEAEKHANPGYRAFYANGFNVVRSLVLFFWEVVLEWSAAAKAKRRDVRPRGRRGGSYPFLRAALCVVVRDLIVYGVLTDMMKGRPAVYATFSSYDEVAHHSGLERADTLEALRKLDQQFGRIERARRYAARPYAIVVLSDHGQTQGATFRQRNGYGLTELVQRSIGAKDVTHVHEGDENESTVSRAVDEATAKKGGPRHRDKHDVSGHEVVVLGSGNLGLIYLMGERHRLSLEEIAQRHPRLIPALRSHPHVGWLLVHSEREGAVVLGAAGARYLGDDRVEGDDPLALFSPTAPDHLLRADGFEHVADIMVGSFYDPALDEGCAFEELISFHGGIGGPQTRPFLLYPAELLIPRERIVGAAAVNELLRGWRRTLNGVRDADLPLRAEAPLVNAPS
jgi:uncharacterized membrane protein YvlD (DUF360 family)